MCRTQRRSDHRKKPNQTKSIRSRSRRTRISRRGHHSRAAQKRHGKIGKATLRTGHDLGKQFRGNTPRHFFYDATRRQRTLRESRSATQTRVDARIDVFENNSGSSSSGRHAGNEQNCAAHGRRSVQGVIEKHVVEENHEHTHCPAKPTTHAFLNSKQKRIEMNFPSRQQFTIDQRTIRFKPDLNPEERYIQK